MQTRSFVLSPEVEAMLEVFQRVEAIESDLSGIVDAAVREYLTTRGYVPPRGPLRITPVAGGGDDPFASVEHDRVLAERNPH